MPHFKEDSCYATSGKYCACIEFYHSDHKRHGFNTSQLIEYTLVAQPLVLAKLVFCCNVKVSVSGHSTCTLFGPVRAIINLRKPTFGIQPFLSAILSAKALATAEALALSPPRNGEGLQRIGRPGRSLKIGSTYYEYDIIRVDTGAASLPYWYSARTQA